MAVFAHLVFWSACVSIAFAFPHNTLRNILRGSRVDFESSGSGPIEHIRGVVKVVRLDHHLMAQSDDPQVRRGLTPRHHRMPALSSRMPFPAFLSRGRASPALAAKPPMMSPLRHLRAENPAASLDLKKKQGLQMWQKAVSKTDHGKMTMSLPVSVKETAKQSSCAAVPFTQRVTAEGCTTVIVHNKLCFGQCSSLFVPSGGEFVGLGAWARGPRRAPCSRCAPSKAHTVAVPMLCGTEMREKRVMVVEECKCETGREEGNAEVSKGL